MEVPYIQDSDYSCGVIEGWFVGVDYIQTKALGLNLVWLLLQGFTVVCLQKRRFCSPAMMMVWQCTKKAATVPPHVIQQTYFKVKEMKEGEGNEEGTRGEGEGESK